MIAAYICLGIGLILVCVGRMLLMHNQTLPVEKQKPFKTIKAIQYGGYAACLLAIILSFI